MDADSITHQILELALHLVDITTTPVVKEPSIECLQPENKERLLKSVNYLFES